MLSPHDFADFMAALDRPAEPGAKMVEVMKRIPPWEKTNDKA